MLTSIYFQICSLFFIVLLIIIYFSKQRLRSLENSIFIGTMFANLCAVIFDILSVFAIYYLGTESIVTYFAGKIYLLCIVAWLLTLCIYIYGICYKDAKKRIKKIIMFITIIFFVVGVVVFALPIYFNNEIYKIYSYGPSVQTVYNFSALAIVVWIIMIGKNFKQVKKRKCIPIVFYVITGSMSALIQASSPEILWVSFVETFVTFLMYFTIENPDVQLTRELYRNRKLIEKSNQDTSNFLFRMTQDIKRPVKEIIDVSEKMQEWKDMSEIKEGIKFINNTSSNLDYLINDALDVSSMTTKRLKIFDSRYNPSSIFKEVKYRFDKQVPEGVKFNFSLSSVIPNYLYGDSIKLKQAVSSILNNAIEHTSTGEIDFDISGIVKYGVCRLIITVSDTGTGMSIEDINDILSLNSDALSVIDLRNRDGEMLNLKEVKKLVSLLGGNLMVKSEPNGGTTVNIVLEQKVVESKETEISEKLESYEQSLYRNKRVMVVDDDAKELAKITTWLENNEAEVSGSLFGRDIIEKIASNIKCDLILLDDETNTYSALDVLKELKKNKKFNIPVVVMIDDNKEFIKLHYLQDGFADCIMKSKLESEINRIMNRF